jgi:rhomboid protease GluP
MDLNYVLSWLVGTASVLWLVALLRARPAQPGWAGVLIGVLALLAAGTWAWPDRAGWVAAAAWAVLVILPSLGARFLQRFLLAERWRLAAAIARAIAILHPLDGWRDLPRQVALLARTRSGDAAAAREALQEEGAASSLRFAKMELFRAEDRWADGRRWIEEEITEAPLPGNPGLLLFYLRALGEVGDLEALLAAHARLAPKLPPGSPRSLAALFVAAFTGRTVLVERLLAGPLASLSRPLRASWRAFALQATGEAEAAASILQGLASSAEGSVVRQKAAARLQQPVPVLDAAALSPAARDLLAGFEREVESELAYSRAGARRLPLATAAFIALNAGVYWLELAGGPEDRWNLERLGALILPPRSGEWWRVFTAGFLHFGPLHLTMNLLGLWVFGSYVERYWGRWRLIAGYLGATFGSIAAVLLLHDRRPTFLVGASGGVLGILGVAIAAVLLGWRRRRATVLRQQLFAFALIVGLQVVFDHFTPMVSSTAHLAGLAIGFLIGLPFAMAGERRSRAQGLAGSPGI